LATGNFLSVFAQAKSQFKRRSTANNVEIQVPVPNDADSPKFKTSVGSVKWAPESSSIVWSIKSFPVSEICLYWVPKWCTRTNDWKHCFISAIHDRCRAAKNIWCERISDFLASRARNLKGGLPSTSSLKFLISPRPEFRFGENYLLQYVVPLYQWSDCAVATKIPDVKALGFHNRTTWRLNASHKYLVSCCKSKPLAGECTRHLCFSFTQVRVFLQATCVFVLHF